MYIVRRLRSHRLQQLLLQEQAFYAKDWTPDTISKWQLEQFNAQWQLIYRSVPYFQRLQEQKNLPIQFSSWQEFKEVMPVMERKTAQKEREALTSRAAAPDFWLTTGGSTAQPLQIPAWKSEQQVATADIWYGRSWFGVAPSDKLFLIWGHSHLLGRGFQGWLNASKRRLKDALLGYYRYCAYDLSEQGLRKAADALLEFQPDFIVAYAVALERFARVNQHRQKEFHRLRMKVAIATAESFPRPDSAEFITHILGTPVAMEYGTVETGPLAHQRPQGKYSAFWRHYFLEGRASEYLPNTYEVLVTSLYPRCFPLVRYRVGDLICSSSDDERCGQEFKTVIGRCNDYVVLPNTSVVHSEAFSHVVKDLSSILGYQVIQSSDGKIRLDYVAMQALASDEIAKIRQRLKRINPELADIRIERVNSLEQTLAGKTRSILREGQFV